MKEVIFMAGVYGVGKSTLGQQLSQQFNIPFYSAGDLISEINKETYGANKVVRNKENNQHILVDAVETKLEKVSPLLLAGHFCIFNKNNDVEKIPEFVFERLHLGQIVLLEADEDEILKNIKKRDNRSYPRRLIVKLLQSEHEMAVKIAKKIDVPLVVHMMKFNQSDLDIIGGLIL